MKKLISVALAILFVLFCFTGCGNAAVKGNTLHFTNRVKDMQKLDGQEITITGYMSDLATDKNYYFYLVSSPGNDAPFSGDHSSELADTIAVYTKAGEKLEHTDSLITVTGTLVFGDFTDSMDYSYTYRIKNASVSPAAEDDLSKNEKKWQRLSQSGIVTRTGEMLNYLEFICTWPTLTMTTNEKDNYLTPDLALYNLEGESSIFAYGREDGYFDKIIEDINSISSKDYSELTKIIEAARDLSERASSCLEKGEYTLQEEYSGLFGDGRKQYALNDGESITEEFNSLAEKYTKWLNSWRV